MEFYINGIGCVSPQISFENESFLEEIQNNSSQHLYTIDPDYKGFLTGMNIRRMSRLIKMGVYAGKKCLIDADINAPDAIITGTGLGASKDTEKFLENIYSNDEGIMSPTQFIQSTHNTVSAQIALMLQCHNYNFTYVHRGASFESALLDGMMLINEGKGKNVLVGGVDELTETYIHITSKLKMWKEEVFPQLELLNKKSKGSIPGEGAAFFMLSKDKIENSYCKLKDMRILFKPKTENFITDEIKGMLAKNDLSLSDLDLVVLGCNGSTETDDAYYRMMDGIFKGSNFAHFKHLCGEYKTASSFGMWTVAQMFHKKQIPAVMKITDFEERPLKNVLIYNNYNNSNHSLILLQNA